MSAGQKTTDCVLPLPRGPFDIKTRATAECIGKKGRCYKRLLKEFRRDGFSYRQIAREENTAIYEQTWSGCAEPSVCYEVIRIRRRDGFQIGETFVEPYEAYPGAEAWGNDGFTVTDKEAAFAKLYGAALLRSKNIAVFLVGTMATRATVVSDVWTACPSRLMGSL
jgi:hypothetical protein